MQEPNLEWEFIDSSIAKVHQQSASTPNKERKSKALIKDTIELVYSM